MHTFTVVVEPHHLDDALAALPVPTGGYTGSCLFAIAAKAAGIPNPTVGVSALFLYDAAYLQRVYPLNEAAQELVQQYDRLVDASKVCNEDVDGEFITYAFDVDRVAALKARLPQTFQLVQE